jgi:hypothetical protein
VRFIPDLLVDTVDDTYSRYNARVVTAGAIERDGIASMEISEDGPTHVDFADRVPVGLLLNEAGGRLSP